MITNDGKYVMEIREVRFNRWLFISGGKKLKVLIYYYIYLHIIIKENSKIRK